MASTPMRRHTPAAAAQITPNIQDIMTKRKIQFSLVYRDMFQSSGKFQPRKDQLERIAPVIIKMGCFSRVETNGGARQPGKLE